MKKMLKHLLAFAFVMTMLFSKKAMITANAYTETAYTGSVYATVTASNGAYVYTKPDTSSSKNDGGVEHGWTVQCLAKTDNGFTKIKYYYSKKSNTFTGYVLTERLTISNSNSQQNETTKAEKFTNIYGYYGVVKTGGAYLNVRSGVKTDGTGSSVITAIPNGTKVNIVAKSTNWYKIQFNHNNKKTTGYVSRKYMKVYDALKKLYINVPSTTFTSSKKYKFTVIDPTEPYALSKKISWSSSKKSVATVTKKGKVTAKDQGTATLTCTIKCGNRSRKIKIKIKVKTTYDLIP